MRICEKCRKSWYYPVERCVFCKGKTVEREPSAFTVKGITEISIPSSEHKEIPYFDLLLVDENGNYHIKKSFKRFKIGDTFDGKKRSKKKKQMTIGIVGTGIMGKGVAEIIAKSGNKVILNSRNMESLNDSVKS